MFRKKRLNAEEKRKLLNQIRRRGQAGNRALSQLYKDYDYSMYIKMYKNHASSGVLNDQDYINEAFIIFRRNVLMNKVDEHVNIQQYITSIAKNLIQNDARRYKSKDLLEEIVPEHTGNSSEILIWNKELKGQLNKLLQCLKPKCIQILTMWKNSYSYQDIAKAMNIESTEKARKQKFYCFQRLKEEAKSFPELKAYYHG